jgi:hypothetical protein
MRSSPSTEVSQSCIGTGDRVNANTGHAPNVSIRPLRSASWRANEAKWMGVYFQLLSVHVFSEYTWEYSLPDLG